MDAKPPATRPVIRRDATGSARTASSWESLTERLIREAHEAGEFDDLPGHGRPLSLDDDRHAGAMASANRLLRNAGAAPPWIEVDKAVRGLLGDIEQLVARARRSSPARGAQLEHELESLLDAHDGAIARLEMLAPTERQHRRRLDRASVRARLRTALAGTDR